MCLIFANSRACAIGSKSVTLQCQGNGKMDIYIYIFFLKKMMLYMNRTSNNKNPQMLQATFGPLAFRLVSQVQAEITGTSVLASGI